MDLKLISALLLLAMPTQMKAQNCTLIFEPKFKNSKLFLHQKYKAQKVDSLEINTLKFYISDIEFLKDEEPVKNDIKKYLLIDAENDKTMNISFTCADTHFDQIRFNVGIDSATNHAGAMGGDLDPTLGMYWTWQNGYINFKMEGKSAASSAPNHEFQYHIGGYSSPFNALQQVILPIENRNEIIIELDLARLFSNIQILKLNHIMSPGLDALYFSKQIAGIFTIKK